MTQVADVMAAIEQIAPIGLAEPWDNVGLMFGGRSWPVSHVLLAVDATPAVVAQAEGLQGVMVVTHHPLFFDPIRSLAEDDPTYAVVSALARASMALYSAHTNLDKSPTHSTALALAEALGFADVRPLASREGDDGLSVESPEPVPGCLAVLPQPMSRKDLAEHVRRRLQARLVQMIGPAEGQAQRVALIPGSGGDVLAAAREAGADIVVTGELKHHEALAAGVLGPAVIIAGHFETERPVLAWLQHALQERLPQLDIRIAEESSPIGSVHTGDCGG